MYSRQPDGFTAVDHNAALLLATHASLALAHAHAAETADAHQTQLLRAIDTRDVIGQAKGILMNRQGIDAEQAFTLLRETSQELNVKLVDLARTIADCHADLHQS
ncbi:ANTAR domain-containing protein [Labedaea rhizosphaerae]|uniref:ANTAR domain-containing protein n=1 Tax=Labedaea rhizosphaerae TaxID=598644 RepID=A0A4R6SA84_LABRH|nr:ANTAR domain-containing protein [Labedaea rhizosphaerae]TDP96731.1 ANTAR domain-containing protein [Labedaea rhizosphaerae]